MQNVLCIELLFWFCLEMLRSFKPIDQKVTHNITQLCLPVINNNSVGTDFSQYLTEISC